MATYARTSRQTTNVILNSFSGSFSPNYSFRFSLGRGRTCGTSPYSDLVNNVAMPSVQFELSSRKSKVAVSGIPLLKKSWENSINGTSTQRIH